MWHLRFLERPTDLWCKPVSPLPSIQKPDRVLNYKFLIVWVALLFWVLSTVRDSLISVCCPLLFSVSAPMNDHKKSTEWGKNIHRCFEYNLSSPNNYSCQIPLPCWQVLSFQFHLQSQFPVRFIPKGGYDPYPGRNQTPFFTNLRYFLKEFTKVQAESGWSGLFRLFSLFGWFG